MKFYVPFLPAAARCGRPKPTRAVYQFAIDGAAAISFADQFYALAG
jgi:hypothetical protein